MNSAPTRVAAFLFAAGLLAGSVAVGATPGSGASSTKQVFRWKDENGVVHYGDAVPPQYADQEKTLLNAQGVQVGTIPGRSTPEQAAAEAARRATEEHAQQLALQSRKRDEYLLATYLTVEEIESLRDRRADILDGQARATGAYLDQLRTRQHQLEQQAQRFKPYNSTANAPLLPERLAEDLVRSASEIEKQTHNLTAKRQELDAMRTLFANDIARFRELKKREADYLKEGSPPAPH